MKKVGGHLTLSKVVHFNNLRLYQRKKEGGMNEGTAGGVGKCKWASARKKKKRVEPMLTQVVEMEPDTSGVVVEEDLG